MAVHSGALTLRPLPAIPNARLRRLLLGWLLEGTANWALMVAIAVYAFDRSGVTALGLVTVARLLPAMVAAPFVGALLDRLPRSRVVGAACMLQAGALTGIAAVIAVRAPLWTIVAMTALSAMVATAARPGLEALLPALADTPAELTVATSAWSAADNGGFLIGSGVGGITLATLGPSILVAAAAVACALAALLTLGLPGGELTDEDTAADEAARLRTELLAGISTVLGSPLLRAPFALFTGLLLLEGATDVQLVALALGPLHMGRGGPGLLFLVWGAAGIATAAATLWVVRRRGYGLALTLGAIAFGGGLAVSGAGGVPLALLAMIPAGLGFSLIENAVLAIVPRLADDRVIGRVYAVSEMLYGGAAGIGAIAVPPLITAVGAGASLVIVGVAYGACGLAAWGFCRRLDAQQDEAGRIRALLRGVPFLAPLPLPRLERLVRAAHRATFAPGEAVVRLGEQGDEFYVIDAGEVAIEEYGRTQGPGSGFGEIALLRDVPRTATVSARTNVELWAIGRPTFIAAVTGSGDASRLAAAVVAEHLARGALSATSS